MEIAIIVKTQEATVMFATKLLTTQRISPNIQSLQILKTSHPLLFIHDMPRLRKKLISVYACDIKEKHLLANHVKEIRCPVQNSHGKVSTGEIQ